MILFYSQSDSVKRKLGSMYGNCAPYLLRNLTVPMLERKIQVSLFSDFCKNSGGEFAYSDQSDGATMS